MTDLADGHNRPIADISDATINPRMSFSENVHAMLDQRLLDAGYQAVPTSSETEASFRSATYEVVIYFDIPNMETDVRVRRLGEHGFWSHIREVVPGANWPPLRDQEEIAPRPMAEIMSDLGGLIERLPA